MTFSKLSKASYLTFGLTLILYSPSAVGQEQSPAAKTSKTRTFLFTYAATITGVPAGQTVRIWLPVPPSDSDQDVQIVSKELPGQDRMGRETKYGNQMIYTEAKAGSDGKVPVSITYRVMRREVKANPEGLSAEQTAFYLQPDAKVPLGGKPLDLIKNKKLPGDPMALARELYDAVNQHMRYSKEGTGWGQGDAVWACESGYGNCSDFHSLFISLARTEKIPAKFEIGFPLPPQPGSGDIAGYHCWAKFYLAGHGWTPVDISEANKNPKMRDYYFGNLTEDRIAFSTGRDLNVVPQQAGPPLNFFVYPYVEVEGKPYPADKVQRKFSYKDVPAAESK